MGTPYAILAAIGVVFSIVFIFVLAMEGEKSKWLAGLRVLGGLIFICVAAYFISEFFLADMRAQF
jgi:hypothetical protein